MAEELLMSISQDERERAVFCSRRMYQTDLQSNLATAEDRGRRIGRQEGKLEIARMMLSAGEPIEKVMNYTGLTNPKMEKRRLLFHTAENEFLLKISELFNVSTDIYDFATPK